MFDLFKNILRKRNIEKVMLASKNRKVVAHNFETANTIGVVMSCFSDTGKTFSALTELTKKYGLEMNVLVYFPQKKLPENAVSNKQKTVFSDNECNWFGKPKIAEVNSFIKSEFNLLIDLSIEKFFPLQYIVSSSNANFKLGCSNEKLNHYDFMLVGHKGEADLIKNIEHYLQKIKWK